MKIPWIVLHGQMDKVCNVNAVKTFVQKVGHGSLIELPSVGHGFGVEKNWLPQFKEAFADLRHQHSATFDSKGASGDGINDLPLAVVASQEAINSKKPLVVIISGDGGWAGFDRDLAAKLNVNGFPVVGLNSLRYFWQFKDPGTVAKDVERVVRHYTDMWKKKQVFLIGYSFGADSVPFVLNRLSPQAQKMLAGAAILGASRQADFEIRVANWLGVGGMKKYDVVGEIKRITVPNVSCLYGKKDKSQICTELSSPIKVVEFNVGHRMNGAIPDIAAYLMQKQIR